jgi:hypothetical protein
MSFKLWFPGREKEYEPYTGLVDEEDVYEAVKEEVEKAISELGSDGYEPIWADGMSPEPVEVIDSYSSEEWSRLCEEADTRGKDHAVMMATPQIFKELWNRYKMTEDGETDIAVDNTTFSKLPDGTHIALTEED